MVITETKTGDDLPDYESVNHAAMAEAEHFDPKDAKRELFADVKEAVKKSSITFGNEPVNYKTVMHEATEYKGNLNNFEATRKEIVAMKASLRKHNFTLGDDRIDYTSDYQRGFGSIGSDFYRSANQHQAAIKSIKADLR